MSSTPNSDPSVFECVPAHPHAHEWYPHPWNGMRYCEACGGVDEWTDEKGETPGDGRVYVAPAVTDVGLDLDDGAVGLAVDIGRTNHGEVIVQMPDGKKRIVHPSRVRSPRPDVRAEDGRTLAFRLLDNGAQEMFVRANGWGLWSQRSQT